jgi:predicted transposase/invertase (TIGR01784 family)
MQIHIIELPKFNKKPNEIKDELESWVEFLKEPSVEVVEMLSKKVPEIVEAFEVLKVVSSNEETRRDAEIRIKAMSDKASSLAGAKEEGLQQGLHQGTIQGKLEIILNMAKNQLDEETISKLTGISLEEIKEMKKQIKDN